MSDDINVNMIADALNNKADRDLNNISINGKSFITDTNAPSDSYINLTHAQLVNGYTAPANGFICINGKDNGVTRTYAFVLRKNNTRYYGISGYSTGNTAAWCNGIMPVAKGDVSNLYTNGIDDSTHVFRFYYTKGANQ